MKQLNSQQIATVSGGWGFSGYPTHGWNGGWGQSDNFGGWGNAYYPNQGWNGGWGQSDNFGGWGGGSWYY
ncbi:hypothetical protein [Rosenbergiella nectarea]|uniref:hypothetical protein n=1 Tax=Rosenbergiella nectarea TaxID=988801 RepID=UPI001BDB4751|nr:hypothetical protein [Rosenbergiella nectarea]MBT0731642.1 hypothetical protein [Rosenbergiella nectarea subsp. apis]